MMSDKGLSLILLSGGQTKRNLKFHQLAIELALKRRSHSKPLSLTYVPFCFDQHRIYYQRMKRRYERLGVSRFRCLNVDQAPTVKEIKNALKSDLVYLAGGNTFYFLKHLKKSGALPYLKEFARQGGVLVGLSAGGLIMTPTIKIAADPHLEPDDPEPGFTQYKALHLVSFEFSPHFTRTTKSIRAHLNYSKKSPYPVYAVQDGGAIVIHHKTTTFFGFCTIFKAGKVVPPPPTILLQR